jgi:hypothetical protein
VNLEYDLLPDDILKYWRHLYAHSRPFRIQSASSWLRSPVGGSPSMRGLASRSGCLSSSA